MILKQNLNQQKKAFEEEVNPKAADENKNEPAPKEDESITPSIPV